MTGWVSDTAWAQLDPFSGRADLRGRVTAAIAVTIGLAVLAVLLAAARTGVISARINGQVEALGVHPGTRTFTESVLLNTDSHYSDQLAGIATGSPGVTVTTTTRLPARIPAHRPIEVTLRFTITDCSAARRHGAPLTLHLHRFWGTLSRTYSQHTLLASAGDFPQNPVGIACR